MGDVRDIYRIPTLTAKALAKRKPNTFVATIEAVYPETFTGEGGKQVDKLVIDCEEGETRIALNKGNAMELAKVFGRDFDDWVGRKIKVSIQKTQFKGESVDGLLVKPAK